jgi:hypothetical protein
MLDHLDSLLRRLFVTRVPSITSEDQVRFQPPDQEWRTVVSNLGVRNALNVYLFEMRENRKLRTNERIREIENGVATDTPAPRRVDCHYLITAWSPATVTPAVEPTLDEHQLLYDVTAVLMNHESLVPSRVYAPDSPPADFSKLKIADSELPTTILPVEGFPKYAEFWGTMGNIHPWKPAIYLVVTVPVALQQEVAGPLVTTRITEYRQSGKPETTEVWIQIGGTVFDISVDPPKAITKAWVRLETTAGAPLQTVESNELGRFTFPSLRAGSYRLRYSAASFSEKVRDVQIPSPTGEYDLRFP